MKKEQTIFREEEIEIMKTKMTKGISIIMLLAVMAAALAGCSSTKLADAFDEDTVKAAAQEAIDDTVAGEYDKVIAMMSEATQKAITAEMLETNMTAMNEQTGAFKEYKSTAVVGQKNAAGEDTAVAVIVAAFEKRSVTYTVSFNADMEIDGFWMK